MVAETPAATVYYDGACPLCRMEISHYRAEPGASEIAFVDASVPGANLGPGLDQTKAMARFHVRRADGQLVSGAAAFASIWQLLPRWRWVAGIATIPGMLVVLEAAYRVSLMVRPVIAGSMKAMMRLKH